MDCIELSKMSLSSSGYPVGSLPYLICTQGKKGLYPPCNVSIRTMLSDLFVADALALRDTRNVERTGIA